MHLKILNTISEYPEKAKSILSEFGDVDYMRPEQSDLLNIISKYDGVVTALGFFWNREVLTKAKNLKFIATGTTGLDHIDLEVAKEKDIEVLSLRGETEFLNTITSTAELSVALMFCLYRKIFPAITDVFNGNWNTENFRGRNLYGKILGIIGLGRLGKMVAAYGKAFGMKVIFFDPFVDSAQDAIKYDFETLLKESDIVSVHVHLNPETENMISKKELEMMKKNAILINTSRGKIVNESDLILAIKSNKIAGYGTDVLSGELEFGNNIPSDHPLISSAKINPNIVILPHIGGMTVDSRERSDIFIAKKIAKYLKIL